MKFESSFLELFLKLYADSVKIDHLHMAKGEYIYRAGQYPEKNDQYLISNVNPRLDNASID